MFVRYVFVIIIFFSADAYAREPDNSFYVSAAVGSGLMNGNDHEKSDAGYTKIGVNLKHESLTAGYVDFGKFHDKHTANTYDKARAYTVSVDKMFQFNRRVGLNITAGLCVWRVRSIYLGNNLGNDNGTGTFVGFAPGIRFNPHTSVFLGVERYFDINGTDITLADVGLTLDF